MSETVGMSSIIWLASSSATSCETCIKKNQPQMSANYLLNANAQDLFHSMPYSSYNEIIKHTDVIFHS
jgi:hypothetical protein